MVGDVFDSIFPVGLIKKKMCIWQLEIGQFWLEDKFPTSFQPENRKLYHTSQKVIVEIKYCIMGNNLFYDRIIFNVTEFPLCAFFIL